MPSGAIPHSLRAESLLSLTRVLWCTTVWVIAVRKAQICPRWCVGQVRQSLSHQKHRSAIRSSSLSLSVTSFPCHLCSLTSSLTLDSLLFSTIIIIIIIIADHVKATGPNIKWDQFDILAKGKTDYHCKIKETLYIQELEPAFQRQRRK